MLTALYFTASWCVPCRTFGPVMDKVSLVPVRRMDVDDATVPSTHFHVMSVPTVILVEGEKEIGRFSGARSLEFVNNFIKSHQGETA